MLRDITPILMGDPGSTYRRNPTPEEMGRHTSEIKWSRKNVFVTRKPTKVSKIYSVKPGTVVYVETRSKAQYLYQRMMREGFGSSIQKLEDDLFAVRRHY